MAHQNVLRINKSSWAAGKNYHVGMKGIEATFTCQPNWTIKYEMGTDENGFEALRVWNEKI